MCRRVVSGKLLTVSVLFLYILRTLTTNVLFKYNQQNATLYNILYYCQCCTCFKLACYSLCSYSTSVWYNLTHHLSRKRKEGSIRKSRNNFCHNSNWITRVCGMSTSHIHSSNICWYTNIFYTSNNNYCSRFHPFTDHEGRVGV